MDDVTVVLEHVDLLDGLDGLHVHLLQRGLQLLVVGAGTLVRFLGELAAGGAFASVMREREEKPLLVETGHMRVASSFCLSNLDIRPWRLKPVALRSFTRILCGEMGSKTYPVIPNS